MKEKENEIAELNSGKEKVENKQKEGEFRDEEEEEDKKGGKEFEKRREKMNERA